MGCSKVAASFLGDWQLIRSLGRSQIYVIDGLEDLEAIEI